MTVVAGSGSSLTDHGLTQNLAPDPVNLDVLAWVGGRLLPREMAKVSVFDSVVQVRGSARDQGGDSKLVSLTVGAGNGERRWSLWGCRCFWGQAGGGTKEEGAAWASRAPHGWSIASVVHV